MLKLLLLTLLLSSALVTVRAQDPTPQPDPLMQAYMEAFPELWERRNELPGPWSEDMYNVYFTEHLYELLSRPLLEGVDETTDVETLIALYELLNQTQEVGYAMSHPYLNLDEWNKRIVERWLADNPVDLSTISEFSFEPYIVTVERHHFTSTAQPDILLRVDREDYMKYWLAVPDGTSYELIPTPVILHDRQNYWASQLEWSSPDITIRDVNGDGLMEIIDERCSMFPGTMQFGCQNYYFVYGWLGDEWQRLATLDSVNLPSELADENDIWEFENLDQDSALELVQDYAAWDNYGCLKRRVQVFDWTGEVYAQISDETTFEETMNCALRFGQAAMFEHDYAAAAEHYALAVARFENGAGLYHSSTIADRNLPEQYAAYAQERLFIAYMLAGQTDNALALLDLLRELEPLENTIAEQILALPADQLTAETVCQTVYDYLENNFKQSGNFYRGLAYIGGLEDEIHIDFDWQMYSYVNAAKAGCDWPHLQQPTPTATPTPHITPASTAIPSPSEAFLGSLSRLFSQMSSGLRYEDPEAVITAADAVLSGVGEYISAESDHAMLARVYRAAALELLGRDEEARAEYTLIYETAPDSIWGGIAAIHLSVL